MTICFTTTTTCDYIQRNYILMINLFVLVAIKNISKFVDGQNVQKIILPASELPFSPFSENW